MSSSPEDFDDLRKLLVCKQYEQPPPGYFRYFSDRVIARIEAEEGAEHSNWWHWLTEKLEARPILACAYGLVVSSLLLVGYKFSELLDARATEKPFPGGFSLAGVPDRPTFQGALGSVGMFERSAISYTTSLSPALRQEPFGDLYRGNNLRVQMAGFSSGR
jgi:hypothetical protein